MKIELKIKDYDVSNFYSKVREIEAYDNKNKLIATFNFYDSRIKDMTPSDYNSMYDILSAETNENIEAIILNQNSKNDVYDTQTKEITRIQCFEGHEFAYKIIEDFDELNEGRVESISESKAYTATVYEKDLNTGEKRLIFSGFGKINDKHEVHFDLIEMSLIQGKLEKPLSISLSHSGLLRIENTTYQLSKEATEKILSTNPKDASEVKEIAYEIYKSPKEEKHFTNAEILLFELFSDREDLDNNDNPDSNDY